MVEILVYVSPRIYIISCRYFSVGIKTVVHANFIFAAIYLMFSSKHEFKLKLKHYLRSGKKGGSVLCIVT